MSRFGVKTSVLVVVVAAAAAGSLAFKSRRVEGAPPPEPAAAAPEAPEDESTIVAWCADGLTAIPGGGCFAAPSPGAAAPPLLVYLHGLYDRSSDAEEMDRQRRVAAKATARGYAVLALRGEEGACHPGVADFATRYCWPSNEQVADRAGEFVSRWEPALHAVERRVGRGPRYVLGFSNGGYFTALLATRGLFEADAFVVAHAGPVEPVRAQPDERALLLLSSDDDIAEIDMLRLDGDLAREGWPHDHYARSGAHGLTDSDIDLALAFLARVHDPIPLDPPLSPHRPHPSPRDDAGNLIAPPGSVAAPSAVPALAAAPSSTATQTEQVSDESERDGG